MNHLTVLIKGDVAHIYDAYGQHVVTIEKWRAEQPTEAQRDAIAWGKWAGRKCASHRRSYEFVSGDNNSDWGRWCDAKASGCRNRLKYKPVGARKNQPYASTWEEAIQRSLKAIYAQATRVGLIRRDPWHLWAETKCSNHNRKSISREAHGKLRNKEATTRVA